MARRRRPGRVPQSKGYKRAARRNQHEGRQWARAVVAEHGRIAVEDF